MRFGFSYIGLFWLLLLFVPNFLWTRRKPANYERFAGNENRVLAVLERAGEVIVTGTVLIFSDFNLRLPPSLWSLWLFASFLLMLLYEAFWIRYFRSARTMRDFYRPFSGIPVAGATLPVLAFALLAVYGGNPILLGGTAILGVGHIGIHLAHAKEAREEKTTGDRTEE